MDGKEFSQIRKELGLTQDELANVLAVSTRAVQSYEQGWRRVVPAAERNLLLLLMFSRRALHAKQEACWEVKKCPEEVRGNCLAGRLDLKDLCWYITGTLCARECQGSWEEKMKKCRTCEVFKGLLQNGKHDQLSSIESKSNLVR